MSTVCDSYNLSGNYRPVESLEREPPQRLILTFQLFVHHQA